MSTVPGADEFAYPITVLEEAEGLRAALAKAGDGAPVCVVGAGPTGIETAAELAEQGHTVMLVCGRVLGPYLSASGRGSVARRMRSLGVRMVEGPLATVVAVEAERVTLADGSTLPSAVTIWTAGFGVPDLAARSGLRTDAIGRLLTDDTLTSVDCYRYGQPDSAFTIEVSGGRISDFYVIRNPDKLASVTVTRQISR